MENNRKEIEVELEEEMEIEEEIEVDSDEENENEVQFNHTLGNDESNKEEIESEDKNSKSNIQEKEYYEKMTSEQTDYNNIDDIHNNNEKNEALNNEIDNEDISEHNISENKKKVRSPEENHYINELVNIIHNEEIIDLIDDKKWEKRKVGYIKLNEYITQNDINKKSFEIIFMYIYIKLNHFKETNFNLIKVGIQCLISLFNQINYNNDTNNNISDKKFVKIVINDLYEKIADNKIKDVYLNLLEILNNKYSYKEILDILFDKLNNTNKITLLKEYGIYIKYLIEIKKILESNKENINLKAIIDFTLKLSNNSNPQIRKISISIFCLLYKYIGNDLNIFIKKIKNDSTIKIIEKEFSKIKVEEKKDFTNVNIEIKNSINNFSQQNNKLHLKKTDISKEIPNQLLIDIDKGKWNEKKEGIEFLHKLLDKSNNNISINGLDNLFILIKNKLKDGNKNLIKLIIELLSHLIDSLGNQIKKYSKSIIPSLLSNLSEKNQQIREECIKCIQKWSLCQNFEIFCYQFPKLLLNDNYEMRLSILDLLIKNCDLITTQYNKDFFNEFIKSLLICLQDKSSTVRGKTEEFIKKFKLFKRGDYIKESREFKPAITEYLLSNIKILFKDCLSYQSFNSKKNDELSLNKNNKIQNEEKENFLNYSTEIKTDRKKKTKILKNNKHNRYDSCPNVLEEDKKYEKDSNIAKNLNNTMLSEKNKKQINNNLENKIKNYDDIDINNSKKILKKLESNKSYDNINNINSKSNVNIKNETSLLEKNQKILFKNKHLKNKKINYIRVNINNNGNELKKDIEFINKSAILSNNSNIRNKNNEQNLIVFLPNYKTKNEEKQNRIEIDIKNNFLFEIQNFEYLKKLKESTKKIFTKEFHKKIFSTDIKDIIPCINRLNEILKSNTSNNNDTLHNLINNLDILLKILGNSLSINQTSSLIKIFFEFSESLINYYINNSMIFTEIESNILLNIFCDKLLNNNVQLLNTSNNLIFKLNEIIGDNKSFMMLIHLIEYKIIKLRYIIIEIIIKIYLNSKIDNTTLSKTLINIINLWFQSDHNLKNKIKMMIQKIYISLGNNEFISITKYLTDKEKNELFLKVLEKDEDFFQENNTIEVDKKFRIRSHSVFQRKSIDKKDDKKSLNIINKKVIHKRNELKINEYKLNKNYNSINTKEIKHKNDILNKEKSYLNIDKKNNNNENEKNVSLKTNKIKHLKHKSQILDDNKILTNIKNNKIKNTNEKRNVTENNFSNSLSEEKLNLLLISLYESTLKGDIKTKKHLMNNVYDTIYHNFSQNKKIIIENSNNIISTLINTTKKYFDIITKEIIQLKNLTNIFNLVCSIKEIIYNITYDVEKKLVELIFFVIIYKDLGKNQEGMSIWKNYNSIMIRVIDYCNPSNTIHIIFEQILINRYNKPKYIEYYCKCLMLLIHNMKDICDKINISNVLFDISEFLTDFNKNQPKVQIYKIMNNKLFITIKEFVYEIVEIRKDKIINDYNNYIKMKKKDNKNINNDKNIKTWINDVLKTLDKDSNYLIK